MIRFHATEERNLPGIMRNGLLKSLATGKRQAVWCVPFAYIDWAVIHVAQKRRCPLSSIVVLRLDVPKKAIKRFAHRGVEWIPADVPPECITVHATVSVNRK